MSALQLRLLTAVVVVLLATAPLFLNPFTITLLNYIGIYGLVALGLVLLTGIGGMMSFGQAAFARCTVSRPGLASLSRLP